MKRPSPALVAEWYGKLRRAGFLDIEGGRDLNQLHASTFPGGDGSRGAAFVDWPDTDFEPRVPLADHPTAVYHRRLAQAAWNLPKNHEDRRLILLACACAGDSANAGRAMGIHPRVAERRLAKFRGSIGLPREHMLTGRYAGEWATRRKKHATG